MLTRSHKRFLTTKFLSWSTVPSFTLMGYFSDKHDSPGAAPWVGPALNPACDHQHQGLESGIRGTPTSSPWAHPQGPSRHRQALYMYLHPPLQAMGLETSAPHSCPNPIFNYFCWSLCSLKLLDPDTSPVFLARAAVPASRRSWSSWQWEQSKLSF